MSDHEKSAELEGKEAERAAIDLIRKEQALRTGTIFDSMLLTYLEDGDSPEFRDNLRRITIEYLREVDLNPHVIKAAIPDWVTRLLVMPMPPVLDMSTIGQELTDKFNEYYDEFDTFQKKRTEGKSAFMAYCECLVEKGDTTIDATADSTDESEDAE